MPVLGLLAGAGRACSAAGGGAAGCTLRARRAAARSVPVLFGVSFPVNSPDLDAIMRVTFALHCTVLRVATWRSPAGSCMRAEPQEDMQRRIDGAVAAAKSAVEAEADENVNDLLACLGQEELKCERCALVQCAASPFVTETICVSSCRVKAERGFSHAVGAWLGRSSALWSHCLARGHVRRTGCPSGCESWERTSTRCLRVWQTRQRKTRTRRRSRTCRDCQIGLSV